MVSSSAAAIGVFDSGIGGLTVAKELIHQLPHESVIYFGDTARVPYGPKSPETVRRYSREIAGFLRDEGVKSIVIACNTATAHALEMLRGELDMPVIGVVEPGARAAIAATRNGHIAVIATEGTVRGGAYVRAIHALKADARVEQKACPLFVALAEEGWTDGEVPERAAQRYLEPLFAHQGAPDTLVLGCTHFPLLASAIAHAAGGHVTLVDSAETTAAEVSFLLDTHGMRRKGSAEAAIFLATDAAERFARVGSQFLGRTIDPAQVEVVDLAP